MSIKFLLISINFLFISMNFLFISMLWLRTLLIWQKIACGSDCAPANTPPSHVVRSSGRSLKWQHLIVATHQMRVVKPGTQFVHAGSLIHPKIQALPPVGSRLLSLISLKASAAPLRNISASSDALWEDHLLRKLRSHHLQECEPFPRPCLLNPPVQLIRGDVHRPIF